MCFEKGNESFSAGLLEERDTCITGGLAALKNKIPATYWPHGQIVHQFIKLIQQSWFLPSVTNSSLHISTSLLH